MAADLRKARAKRLADKANEKYGEKSASIGHIDWGTTYYSTGVNAIDYILGTGGVPDNAFTEAWGPSQIGKTSSLGAGVLRSVQQAGGLTATIATEPDFDEKWMERLGVDPDLNLVYRPDTGEEAFTIMRDLVYNKDVEYILWDSLAATSSEKEQGGDKPMAFGNASLNNWGIKNVATRCFKNHIGVMFINQIRDDNKSKIPGLVKPPGGHAIEHWMKVRIQLKPGKQKYTIKVPSTEPGVANEDLLIGREIRAEVIKNKAAEGIGKKAVFEFWNIETDDNPFGFNWELDLVRTGKISGVITGSGWLVHELFPGGKINGEASTVDWVRANPKAAKKIRDEIMQVAEAKSNELALKKIKEEKKSA